MQTHNITPESHPETWALLQPPEASTAAPSREDQIRSIRDSLSAASSALYPLTSHILLNDADHHLALAIDLLGEYLGETE